MLGNHSLNELTRRYHVEVALVLLVLATAGDYATGADIGFTLLYLVPIAVATWFRNRRFGLGIALFATAGGTWSAAAAGTGWFSVAWNQASALGIFVAGIFLLARLRATLDEERRKRTAAIAQLRHAERLNVIGTLAAGVAHELGTPLSVISGNAELIDTRHVTYERVHRSAQTILQQTQRMTAIISHLLEFGRRGGANREWADVRALITRTAALLETLATKAGCEIRPPASTDELWIWVNRGEVEQVLANLVVNAVQASPAGGRVRIDCERAVSHGRPIVALSVEDDGCGIAPEDLPHIFDPFFTTKGVGQGTGLGLSVSYGIVEDHGGVIHVKSERGHGSRFVVELPIGAAASELSEAPTPPPVASSRAETVS